MDRVLNNEISENYGREKVLIRTIEELSELVQELSTNKIDRSSLAEEIADCRLCFYWLTRHWSKAHRLHIKRYIDVSATNINILSKMQFCLTKELRGYPIKQEHLDQLGKCYFVLDFLTDEYDLKQLCSKWTRKKEQKYRNNGNNLIR